MCTSPNSGHTATVLRTYAQIRLCRTSHFRKTLYDIPPASKGISFEGFRGKEKTF